MANINRIPYINNELSKLDGKALIVGVPLEDEFLQMIARVNETGKTIKPKKGDYLAVPDGHGGIRKLKQVVIPPRPWLQWTVDHKSGEWGHLYVQLVSQILLGNGTAEAVIKGLGERMVADFKETIKTWDKPGNAPLTVANKGKDDPLVDTGRLMNSMMYVVKGEV